jgi:formylglycine-generating enzyme
MIARTVLRAIALTAALLAASSALAADVFQMPSGWKSLEFASVGNAGNASDKTGYGAVSNSYSLAKYDVTAGQYVQFLNAVASDDPYGLYAPEMAASADCNIQRLGSPGGYSYSVDSSSANRPVNYLSFGSAARFCNWLTNGQKSGAEDATTTEDGSYFLNGATSNAQLLTVVRKSEARYVLPTIDEWYKAAYHKNDGITGNFWLYPTRSDAAPVAEAPPGRSEPPGSANYHSVLGAVHLSDVGAYLQSPGPYGTFDQGGLLYQWTDSLLTTTYSGFAMMNSSWLSSSSDQLRSDYKIYPWSPVDQYNFMGFRVAEVPEPSTLWLAGACLLLWGGMKAKVIGRLARVRFGVFFVAAAMSFIAAPAWAGFSLPGYTPQVVKTETALNHADAKYFTNGLWESSGLDVPMTTNFTLPVCQDIRYARLYLDVWGGTNQYLGQVTASLNGTNLPLININGTSDSNPTFNGSSNCVYGTGSGVWQIAYSSIASLLKKDGTENVLNFTVTDPHANPEDQYFDGRTFCASLMAVYTDPTINQSLDYFLAEADGTLRKAPGTAGSPTERTVAISGVNTSNVVGAQYTAGYTHGTTDQKDQLYFNNTRLGNSTNDVALGDSLSYGPSNIPFNVKGLLAATNSIRYSVKESVLGTPGEAYLRANVGLLTVTHPAFPTLSTWLSAASGDWGTAGNWNNGIPQCVTDTATFGNVSGGASTVQVRLGANRTLSQLAFTSTGSRSYTITRQTGDTSSALILDNGASPALVTVTGTNNHTIDAPVVLRSDATFTTTAGKTLTVSKPVGEDGGAKSVMKNGNGTLVFSQPNTYTGNTTVNGGTLTYSAASGSPAVGIGAILTINDSAKVFVSGATDPFTSGSVHQSIVNHSKPSGSDAGLNFNSGHTIVIGRLDGLEGSTRIANGTILTASYIRQDMLILDGGSKLILGTVGAGGASAVGQVPEPGTMILLISGMAATLSWFLYTSRIGATRLAADGTSAIGRKSPPCRRRLNNCFYNA